MLPAIIKQRYRITRPLASGRISQVYIADDLEAHKPVVVKLIQKEFVDLIDPIIFENELFPILTIRHPNVISVLDGGTIDAGYYLILEFFNGQNLDTLLHTQSTRPAEPARLLSIEQIIDLLTQICQALGHLHSKGIIHHALKPSNILWREELDSDHAKKLAIRVTDFGIKKIRTAIMEAKSNRNRNSDKDFNDDLFYYAAPEQFYQSEQPPDEQSDLYAIGVIMYTLFAGKLPFSATTIQTLVHQHLTFFPDSIRTARPDIPPGLEQIIYKLLEKNREVRYRSCAGLLNDLDPSVYHQVNFKPGMRDTILQLNREIPYIDRHEEYAKMHMHIKNLEKGRGCFCLISGEAGIGKSRFVKKIVDDISVDTANTVIFGKCSPLDSVTPFSILIQAFENFINANRADPTERDNPTKTAIIKLLQKLNRIDQPPHKKNEGQTGTVSPRAITDPEKVLKNYFMDIAHEVLKLSISIKRLIIILEDIHWADANTIHLLQETLFTIKNYPLMIIGTSRESSVILPEQIKKLLRYSVEKQLHLIKITLPPLAHSQLNAFIGYAINRNSDDEVVLDIAHFIQNNIPGNPFLIIQLLEQLMNQRIIITAQGMIAIDHEKLKKFEFPSVITNALLRKQLSLEEEEKIIFCIAAVCGERFDAALLTEIADRIFHGERSNTVETLVQKTLAMGQQLYFLREQPDEKGIFNFTHDTIREAFPQLINQSLRNSIHFQLFQHFEKQYQNSQKSDDRASPTVFKLGYHAINSGDHNAIMKYGRLAGMLAKQIHAYHDALHYFSAVLMLYDGNVSSSREFIQISMEIGDVYLSLGKNQQAINVYSHLLYYLKDPAEKIQIYKQLCFASYKMSDLKNGEQYAVIGLSFFNIKIPVQKKAVLVAIAKELFIHLLHSVFFSKAMGKNLRHGDPQPGDIMWFYSTLNWLYFFYDQIKFLRLSLHMLNLSERGIGPSPELAMSQCFYAVICMFLRLYKRGMQYLDNAMKFRMKTHDTWGVAQTAQFIGYLHYYRCQFETAVHHLAMSIELFNSLNDIKEVQKSLMVEIICFIFLADYGSERTAVTEYQKISEQLNDQLGIAFSEYSIGEMFVKTGDYARAKKFLLRSLARSYKHEIWFCYCGANAQLGVIAMHQGQMEKALEYLDRAVTIHRTKEYAKEHTLYIFFLRANAYIAAHEKSKESMSLREQSASLRKIKHICREANRLTKKSRLQHFASLWSYGKYYALTGAYGRAKKIFTRCLAYMNSLSIRTELGVYLYEYGMVLLQSGNSDEATTILKKAYQELDRISNQFYKKKVLLSLNVSIPEHSNKLETYFSAAFRQERLRTLTRIDTLTHASISVPEKLNASLAIALESLGATRGCFVRIYNNEISFLSSNNMREPLERIHASRIYAAINTLDRKAASGSPVQYWHESIANNSTPQPLRYLSVPLFIHDTGIGIFYCENHLVERIFSADDITFARQLFETMEPIFSSIQNAGSMTEDTPNKDFCAMYQISEREREIINLYVNNYTVPEIGEALAIKDSTIYAHVKKIFIKTGVTTKRELITLIRSTDASPHTADQPGMDNTNSAFRKQYSITGREYEIIKLIMGGYNNREIAEKLCISIYTVYKHMKTVYAKTGAQNHSDIIKIMKRYPAEWSTI